MVKKLLVGAGLVAETATEQQVVDCVRGICAATSTVYVDNGFHLKLVEGYINSFNVKPVVAIEVEQPVETPAEVEDTEGDDEDLGEDVEDLGEDELNTLFTPKKHGKKCR